MCVYFLVSLLALIFACLPSHLHNTCVLVIKYAFIKFDSWFWYKISSQLNLRDHTKKKNTLTLYDLLVSDSSLKLVDRAISLPTSQLRANKGIMCTFNTISNYFINSRSSRQSMVHNILFTLKCDNVIVYIHVVFLIFWLYHHLTRVCKHWGYLCILLSHLFYMSARTMGFPTSIFRNKTNMQYLSYC